MTKSKTHFEQVPLELARKAAEAATPALISCAICGKAVVLEKCKIDERGHAVHEDCYFHKLAGRRVSPSSTKRKTAR
jgi:hypothetical protein